MDMCVFKVKHESLLRIYIRVVCFLCVWISANTCRGEEYVIIFRVTDGTYKYMAETRDSLRIRGHILYYGYREKRNRKSME